MSELQSRLGASVTCRSLSHAFREGEHPVLDGLSLDITPGEFVAVLGPSGCGKSTLLKLVAGLDRPAAGSIGIDSKTPPPFQGFVFQDPRLLPWRSVLRNVMLPLELSRASRPVAEAAANEALSRVGYTESRHAMPAELSGGMKMRVSIARALTTEPTLLLMDEPFSALDETSRHRLQSDLRELWLRRRMTVLFVTHSVAEAVFLASRIVVLSKRPARIVWNEPVLLPEWRDHETRMSPAFNDELKRIYHGVPVQKAEL